MNLRSAASENAATSEVAHDLETSAERSEQVENNDMHDANESMNVMLNEARQMMKMNSNVDQWDFWGHSCPVVL
jgi:hypothetical protein